MNGILMKPWKIKFIADHPGLELQTRRLITTRDNVSRIDKVPPSKKAVGFVHSADPRCWIEQLPLDLTILYPHSKPTTMNGNSFRCRYSVGEIVYIKEAHYAYGQWLQCADGWIFHKDPDTKVVVDNADWKHALRGHSSQMGWYKRSAMFMFASDARYFIKILDVTPQRLQEITIQDVVAEGIMPCSDSLNWVETTMHHFKTLWDSINPHYPFSANPQVWRYSFELVKE